MSGGELLSPEVADITKPEVEKSLGNEFAVNGSANS